MHCKAEYEIQHFFIVSRLKCYKMFWYQLLLLISLDFVFERKDRGNTGVGGGIYLKGDINYLRRHDFENAETKFICLEILQNHSMPKLFVYVFCINHQSA